MIDYTIFYKRQLSITDVWGPDEHWDLFISAYVPAERTIRVFQKAKATNKRWLLFPEYGYNSADRPTGKVFHDTADDVATFVTNFWQSLLWKSDSLNICVDITGFVRPYLIFFVRWLFDNGVKKFDAIYSEPVQYHNRELTEFSGDAVKGVRQVAGCEGVHTPDSKKDLLIIGAGYDDNLISRVADDKAKATKLQLLGFPSLRADMYQENVLRAHKAEESLGGTVVDSFLAPANDPFVAANVLHEIVDDWKARKGLTNLYLCPLSTKAHVLGFTLFYLTECRNTATSIIFPFEEQCRQNTSKGIARIWKYTVELPPR